MIGPTTTSSRLFTAARRAAAGRFLTAHAWLWALPALAVLFAFWPADRTPWMPPARPDSATESIAPVTKTLALDASAYAAVLWTPDPPAPAPPPPPPPPPDPPRPPALRLVLLGVHAHHGTGTTASIYCQETDRVLRLSAGDRAGPFEVRRIDAAGVIFHDGIGELLLSLDVGSPETTTPRADAAGMRP